MKTRHSVPVFVVVPYVDRGVTQRADAFAFVADRWKRTLEGAEVVVSGGEPFSWTSALNSAIRALPADAIVVHSDPDSYVMPHQAREAVRQAREADGLVVAFSEYLYLTEPWTHDILAGRTSPYVVPSAVEARGAGGVGNVTVYRRTTWEAAGGYDERFDGAWGGADACYAYATGHVVAPLRRVAGPMFHLWHPRLPESEPDGPGYVDQFAIVGEYRDAADANAIRRIVRRRVYSGIPLSSAAKSREKES